MMVNKPKSPEEILQRLDDLRKWQEQQQQLLIQRQNTQRRLLDEEQRKLYEQLGLSVSVSSLNISNTDQEQNERCTAFSSISSGSFSKPAVPPNISNNDRESVLTQESGYESAQQKNKDDNSKSLIKKRPFLKKGEGLTSRFKINPEKLRLDNLPKYKFAIKGSTKIKKRKPPEPGRLPKKFSDSGPYRGAGVSDPASSSNVRANVRPKSPERYYSCSSKEIQEDLSEILLSTSFDKPNINRQELSSFNESTPINKTNLSAQEPVSWADVLNPNNIKPISLDGLRKYMGANSSDTSFLDDDGDGLSLFEMLEKKAQDGSLLLDSNVLQRWMKNIQSPVKDFSSSSICDSESTIISKRVSPLPCDINGKIQIDESDASSTVGEDEFEFARSDTCRVRFSEKVIVNEITSESENDTDSTETSFCDETNSNPQKMHSGNATTDQISLNDSLNETDFTTTLTNDSADIQQLDLLEKSENLKARLVDLEKEIVEFQKHNTELIKLKQECEMEKIRFEQERNELTEKLKDERIKMEIELHDERVKLEEEKKKYEKMMREHRSKTRKENEEISQLKDKIEQLQKENREKEMKHSASQARMRAQIRNLEEEMREFSMEIDVLKKEKRRLESENAKLMRNNNNKMLQEINKSIAKLVPKTAPIVDEVRNKSQKPIVVKVTSHFPSTSNRSQSRTRSQDTAVVERSSSSSESNAESDVPEALESAYFRNKSQHGSDEDRRSIVESKENCHTREEPENTPAESVPPRNDDFKREILNSDGSKDIWYTNGNLKKISADGMLIRMLYYNKDIKETNINEGTVKYYYAETNTWHTTYLDGLEILEFPNGQVEHRYKDGTVEVHFENGAIRITDPNDPAKIEEWRYPDGAKLVQLKTGDKIIIFANGQKEVHTKLHKRREYPDGTVKIVYPDGSQETRYSNGRVRLKDKDGNLIMDSEQV